MKNRGKLTYVFLALVMIASLVAFCYFALPLIETARADLPSIILLVLSISIAVVSLALIIGIAINNHQRTIEVSLKNRLSMWNSISYKVKKAGEIAFNNLPIGIIIISSKKKILWSNNEAKDIFKSPLENIDLKNISKELDIELNDKEEFIITIYGEIYQIKYVKENNIIYLTKQTDFVNLQTLYDNRICTLGYINIDNFEEALSEFDVQERAEYSGKIIGMIAKWFEKYGAYVRAFTDNRYLLIMDKEQLDAMMATSFPLLDDIKTIMHNGRALRITLSIGICCADKPIMEVSEEALDLLDLSLNRGGDQVAVKVNDKTTFYGAKQEAIPKDNKVDIRIKSEELQDLFISSSNIFVMAHKNTDTDGFGASLGLYKMAKALGKEAYIVQDTVDATVAKIVENIHSEYVELKNDIITPKKAISLSNDKSLLMIVDFQTIYQSPDNGTELGSPNERIIKRFKNIAIIDHHRKGAGAIENSKFYYSKTYSSSSVEIILELLEFWKKPVDFSPVEATWLLLGIIVDTNNFIYRANAKTFEVSSILKRFGADMTVAQRYLKEDIEEIRNRNMFTNNIRFYKDIVAISCANDNKKYERAEIAKISDGMLDIENVELGITIAYLEDNLVGLSARSLGLVNAQTIMEKLGGGGHLNNAAAQVKNSTIEQVYERLIEVIDSAIEESKSQKVVFLKDIRGRGKKFEIKDLDNELATRLLEDGSVIIASPENIKTVENIKNKDEIEEEKKINDLLKIKELLESKPLRFSTKVEDGEVKDAVTDKQIKELIYKEFDIKIDNKKLEMAEPIKGLGTFVIPVSFDKGVTANVTLYITEE